jgi:hypothetical protein
LKKSVLALIGFILLFTFGVGSVSADQIDLKKSIDEVVGTPYKWGGTTPSGFDCSGFILYIFNQYETKLPRTSKSMSQIGTKVEKEDLRPGDLVFFNTFGKGVSHAGIYIGDGQFAHSSTRGVKIEKLSDTYYDKRYITARRVVSGENYENMINDNNEVSQEPQEPQDQGE